MDIEEALREVFTEMLYGTLLDQKLALTGFRTALDATITEAVTAALATKETGSP